jgi:hypothetical protein
MWEEQTRASDARLAAYGYDPRIIYQQREFSAEEFSNDNRRFGSSSELTISEFPGLFHFHPPSFQRTDQ